MYFFRKQKNKVLFILGIFLIFHNTLFANSLYVEMKSSVDNIYMGELIGEEKVTARTSRTEVSLDFGDGSMIVVLILTSLLGLFFVRDELGVL